MSVLASSAFAEAESSAASLRVVESPAGGVEIQWTRPAGPNNLLGWHVERQLSDGTPRRVSAERVEPGLFDSPATVYRIRDAEPAARAGDAVACRLVTVDLEGQERPGPWSEVVIEAAGPLPPAPAAPQSLRTAASAKSTAPSTAKAAATGSRIRIVVTNDGVYRLTAAQITALLQGYDEARVARAISQNKLALSRAGAPVAWRGEGGGRALLFYGQAYQDVYTDRNFYWLEPGPGLPMNTSYRNTSTIVNDAWFWDTVRAEVNQYFSSYLPGRASDDYYVWTGTQVTAPSTAWQWTTTVPLPDLHPDESSGVLTAHLVSAYDGPPALDNRTQIYADGNLADDRQWAGDQRLSQSGTTGHLTGSSVDFTIKVQREAEVTTTKVMIDAVEVRYARRMRARDDQLLFSPRPGAGTVTVDEFTSSIIHVFEVSDPLRPVKIAATITQQGNGNWRVSWSVNPAAPGRYLAAAVLSQPERIDGVPDSGWGRVRVGAPHVVIAPRALTGKAYALVAHRRSQGLHSLLIAIEDLYDIFTYGRPDPRAIPRFLAYARSRWIVKPEYVCLAGDGHTDYLDHFGQAATRPNHVPPMQERIPYDSQSGVLVTLGLDNSLADTDGDGFPDLAIGRLPAQTPEDLAEMIQRIKLHESSESWKRDVLLIADKDEENAFILAGRRTEAHVPPWLGIHRLDHTPGTPVDTMRTRFVQAMNSGVPLAFYFGHANNIGISSPYFFEHSYVRSHMSLLTNLVHAPILIAGTCLLNDFSTPHPDNRCLGKGFLDTAPGGAVAVWASASESTLGMAESTAQAMLDKFAAAKEARLGDLVKPALEVQAASISPWTVRSSILLGDPGTRLRSHLVLDRTPPQVRITRPTSASRYSTTRPTVDVSGTASDLNGVVRVVVGNDRGRSETAANGTANWRLDRLPLYHGENRITVEATDQAGNTATTSLLVTYTPVSAIRRRINCGGGTSARGWRADFGVVSPTGRRGGGSARVSGAGSVPSAVYKTRRYGRNLAYRFNLPGGKYGVRLFFAESFANSAGRRLFDVQIEGRRRLRQFDIFRAAGRKHRAVTRTFRNVPVSGGLDILATASRGTAQFNGIEFWSELPRILVRSSPLTVREGYRKSFAMKLSDPPPSGAVTVWVERVSGDADIQIASRTKRVFTAANYATEQPIVLAADLDADSRHGTTKFRCSALGYVNTEVVAREHDRDIPKMTVSPSVRSVSSSAGGVSFTVANEGRGRMAYTARPSDSWIRIGRSGRGINRGRVVATFAANPSVYARTGTVTVTAPGTINSPRRVRIVQSGRPSLYVWPSSRSVDSAAGSTTFVITNRGDGAIRYTAQSSAYWLRIDQGGAGVNAGRLTVSVSRNLSAAARTGTLTVTAPGAAGSPRRVTVVQAGNPPDLSVDPESYAFGEIPIGTSEDVVFTVVNQGGGTVIGSATVSAPFWIVSGGSYRLAAGERQEVKVRYSPVEAGVHNTYVRFAGAGEEYCLVTGNASWTPAVHRKINSGSIAAGAGWEADGNWTGIPAAGSDSNAVAIADAGDIPASVYQTRRFAQTLTYDLAIPDGLYTVRLHFNEPVNAQAGRRVFDVTIEGATVQTNFDIFAAAGGRHRAVTRTCENIEVSGGLQIQGIASISLAQFNGIEVWSAEESGPPPAPAKRTSKSMRVSGPAAWARSGEGDWTAAPEVVDGDPETIWRGDRDSSAWALTVDLEAVIPLQQMDIFYADQPWAEVDVLGAVEVGEWFDLGQAAERPVSCRFLFIQFLDNGSDEAPAVDEVEWTE